MKKKYNGVVFGYFSDMFGLLICLTIILAISVITVLATGGVDNYSWIAFVLLAIIYSLYMPHYILFFKAARDVKEENIACITVKNPKFQFDDGHTFKSRGVTVGKEKWKIFDDNDNYYLLQVEKGCFCELFINEGIELEIHFLTNSRLVTKLKITEPKVSHKKAVKRRTNTECFKESFYQYFY
jgi:hypothetical protein